MYLILVLEALGTLVTGNPNYAGMVFFRHALENQPPLPSPGQESHVNIGKPFGTV